jgi:archaemetzincin
MKPDLFFRFVFALFFAAVCPGCNSLPEKKLVPVKIVIQPFMDMPEKNVDFLRGELMKLYPYVEVRKAIALPSSAYYGKRKRYRADSLIRYLKDRTHEGQITIGLTNKDISHTNGNIIDYGIMGLGYRPGKSCITSTFRLSKNNMEEQFFKLAIHEIGHTQGLDHCSSEACYMRDAEGRNHFDELKRLCGKCRKHLSAKGWQFLQDQNK